MRFAIPILALLLLSAETQAAEIAEFSLKLKPAEVQAIGKALGQLPYNEVAALLENLTKQVNEQVQAAANPPAEAPK